MAIDTERKRKSVVAAAFWRPAIVVPDGSLNAADRQTAGRSYAGILAASPPPPPDTIRQAGLMVQIGKLMNR